jgi:hypothetical protein
MVLIRRVLVKAILLEVGRESAGGASRAIALTKEQQAIDAAGATPPQVVDPRTSAAYVLIPAEEYEAILEVLVEERQQRSIQTVAPQNATGRIQEVP